MRTLMSCFFSVASICPTNKSENLCEQTNREPLLHDMRCAIVDLMTFLVVAAFKPKKTLHRPSLKLGSDVAWSQSLVWFSSSRCLILFMTAHPTWVVYCCLHLVLICLCTKCCRKLATHLLFVCLYWNWKLLELVYCVHLWSDSPWVIWG